MLYLTDIKERYKIRNDAELAELLGEEIQRGAEHGARQHDMVAGLQQRHDHHEDRTHAAGRADGGLGAFHRGEPLLEAGDGGI